MKNLLISAVASLTLAGCVSAGTNFSLDTAYGLQPGQSAQSVVQAMGKPNAQAVDADGNTVLVWVRIDASPVGAKSRVVRLLFDKQGKLIAAPQKPLALGQ
jgi:hypothetical protein